MQENNREEKGKDTLRFKINLKTGNQILSLPHNKILTSLGNKDKSCQSKRRQKQANYFEINHFNCTKLVPI